MTNNTVHGNCSGPLWQATAEKRTAAVHLQGAGYRTGFFGKYLNMYGFEGSGGPAHVPPGWTRWYGLVGNSIYYNFTVSDQGKTVTHSDVYEQDYLTKLVHEEAKAFIQGKNSGSSKPADDGQRQPFFAWIAPPAAHDPTMAAPQHAEMLPDAKAPRVPSYGASPEGKHWEVRFASMDMGEGTDASRYGDLLYRRRLLTLLSVDDMLGDLVDTLDGMGELDNTFLVFASDNGYHIGTFGLLKDKRQLYETDIRVPAYVRGPGVGLPAPKDPLDDARNVLGPVLNIDFAPTFLDMAGIPQPEDMDGASFLGLIKKGGGGGAEEQAGEEEGAHVAARSGSGGNDGGDSWRNDFLVEYHGERSFKKATGPCLGEDGTEVYCNIVGPEMKSRPPMWEGPDICSCQDARNNTYRCVRDVGTPEERAAALKRAGGGHQPAAAGSNVTTANTGFVYCRFDDGLSNAFDGEEEYYDLEQDPWQLRNAVGDLSQSRLAELRERLAQLAACKYSSCRQ